MASSEGRQGTADEVPDGRKNRLLHALPEEDYRRLTPYFEHVKLGMAHVLLQPHRLIEYAYFPLRGIASMVTVMTGGKAVEVATIGNEGMVGLPLSLGVDTSPNLVFIQVPGESVRIPAKTFQKEMNRHGGLAKLMQLYMQALFVQVSQGMSCNAMHSIERRTARWLLMTHDRVATRQFPLSQEFLGNMLGVRRAGVSEVASKLQKAGLIRYSRGVMEILDRARLEATACECYEAVQQEFVRLLGTPRKTATE